jgi:hypothetical protein
MNLNGPNTKRANGEREGGGGKKSENEKKRRNDLQTATWKLFLDSFGGAKREGKKELSM